MCRVRNLFSKTEKALQSVYRLWYKHKGLWQAMNMLGPSRCLVFTAHLYPIHHRPCSETHHSGKGDYPEPLGYLSLCGPKLYHKTILSPYLLWAYIVWSLSSGPIVCSCRYQRTLISKFSSSYHLKNLFFFFLILFLHFTF